MNRSSRLVALVALIVIASACASSRSDSGLGNAKVRLVEPDLEIVQLSGVPPAARHVEGSLPVQYRLRVANRSAENITLKQITVQSMGYGAYNVNATSRPFDQEVSPDGYEDVEFWVPASIDSASMMGANGPVTLRIQAHFDSPVGQFEKIVVKQVNGMPGRSGNQ